MFWGMVWAAVCDCGTPWTFLLPFFYSSLGCFRGVSIDGPKKDKSYAYLWNLASGKSNGTK